MPFVTVRTSFNSMDAQLARSRLDAAGFHPFVAHENAALSMDGYALAAGGILVQVPDAEAEDARALLDSYDSPTEQD